MRSAENLSLNVAQNKTASDLVFEQLKRDVITGRLKPGQRLVERELTKRYQVSRTPLREALKELVRAGFAVNVPYRGVAIRTISYEYARKIYELRVGIEGLSAYLAAERASEDEFKVLEEIYTAIKQAAHADERDNVMLLNMRFHELIASATRNDLLVENVQELWATVNLLRGTSWIGNIRTSKSSEEHGLILEALLRRNPIDAREAAEQHIQSSWQAVSAAFRQNSQKLELDTDLITVNKS